MIASTIIILLSVILATSTVFAAGDENAGKGFIYIGSFPSATQNFDMNRYYVSGNPTVWSAAELDCYNMSGRNGGLLAVDSIAEWEFLRVALEPFGFGTTYWTSGMYDHTTSVWRWSSNQQPIPPYPPWGPGFPSGPIPAHRILIYHTNRYDAFWRTVGDTQAHRYICELQTSVKGTVIVQQCSLHI